MRIIEQYAPDGTVSSRVRCTNQEACELYEWMLSMRNRGYIGPFLLKGMLEKIRREYGEQTA